RRVSVVIPTYERRRWVCRAVESVLAQTRPADEILVVDDGSSDGTADELARRFGARVRVLVQPNGGVAAARNAGVRAARHPLVAFLDSDDCWLPSKLERQLPLHDDPSVVASLTNWCWRRRPESGAFQREGLVLDGPCVVDRAPLGAIARVGGTRFLVQTAIC